jgi:hypothetical protein
MKILLFGFGFCLFLISCGNNNAGEPVIEDDSTTGKYSWVADDTGQIAMSKRIGIGPDTLSSDAVIAFQNATYPNVQLVFVKTSGDTLFVKIPSSTILTQQMGTSGASTYMASAVYNLTEIPGIHFVNLDFEEGDHASPGTYSRDSFKNQ